MSRKCSQHSRRESVYRATCLAAVCVLLSAGPACVGQEQADSSQQAKIEEAAPPVSGSQGNSTEPDGASSYYQSATGACCQVPHFLDVSWQLEEAGVCYASEVGQHAPAGAPKCRHQAADGYRK